MDKSETSRKQSNNFEDNQFIRTELLLGEAGIKRLSESKVIIFGVGGVGSFAAEAITRSGVGFIDIVDNDNVSVSNINRQLIAGHSTIGLAKTDIMRDRILDINPSATVNAHKLFYDSETAQLLNLANYDYVVDAIDSVDSKLLLIENAKKQKVPIISSMGAGNKLNPTMLRVGDIYETSVCPLAKVIRKKLREKGITSLKTVYSTEPPLPLDKDALEKMPKGEKIIGSISFVPSVCGLIIAGEVIKYLITYNQGC